MLSSSMGDNRECFVMVMTMMTMVTMVMARDDAFVFSYSSSFMSCEVYHVHSVLFNRHIGDNGDGRSRKNDTGEFGP